MNFWQNSYKSNITGEKRFIKSCYRSLGSKRSEPPAKKGIRKKRRSELLIERRNNLVQTAGSAAVPDVITVHACLIYMRAYFGSERRMIYELIISRARWQLLSAQVRTEIWLERIYYRFVRGYTEKQWQALLNTKIEHSADETTF